MDDEDDWVFTTNGISRKPRKKRKNQELPYVSLKNRDCSESDTNPSSDHEKKKKRKRVIQKYEPAHIEYPHSPNYGSDNDYNNSSNRNNSNNNNNSNNSNNSNSNNNNNGNENENDENEQYTPAELSLMAPWQRDFFRQIGKPKNVPECIGCNIPLMDEAKKEKLAIMQRMFADQIEKQTPMIVIISILRNYWNEHFTIPWDYATMHAHFTHPTHGVANEVSLSTYLKYYYFNNACQWVMDNMLFMNNKLDKDGLETFGDLWKIVKSLQTVNPRRGGILFNPQNAPSNVSIEESGLKSVFHGQYSQSSFL